MRFYCITSLSQYTHYKNKDNKTALLEQLNKDFMAYLRGKEYGNSKVLDRHTNKSEKDRLLEFKVLFGPDWNINMRFEFNDTPLLIAISNSRDDIAQELIKAGADLGMSNDFGEFPLYAAIHHSRINVFFEIIKRFKSNINCLSTGFTPLNLASAKNLPEITKALLENGADPNLLDKFGKTALKVAEAKNYTAVIKVLNKYKKNKCQFITHNWGSNHLISGN